MNERRYPYGRPDEGMTIHVATYGSCEVLLHTDPSLVRLLTPHGAEVKIGHKALRLALVAAEGEDVTAHEGAKP